MNTRNTKQKELILETLCSLHSHPTILELYDIVRSKNPTIGQATVYRNVAKLVEEGRVKRVLTKDGIDHYDGDCSNHSHFMCRRCHRLFDLPAINTNSLVSQVSGVSSFDISSVSVLFEGICRECK